MPRRRMQGLPETKGKVRRGSLESEGHLYQFPAESSPVYAVLDIIFSNYIFCKVACYCLKAWVFRFKY